MAERKPPPGSGNVQDYFGSGTFDEDHFGDAGPSLDLDTDDAPPRTSGAPGGGPSARPGPERSVRPPVAADDDLDLYESTAAATATAPPMANVDRRIWPTGRSPDSASLRIDSVEIRLAAGYGTPPTMPLLAPRYTLHVLARKRELTERVKALSDAADLAAKNRDERLMQLVQERRGTILMTDEGEALFEPIIQAEAVALERRSALSGANAEYDRITAELAAELAGIEAESDAQARVVEAKKGALAEASRAHGREEAKKKRLYIELAGLVDIQEKAGGVLAPAQSARVAELEREIATHKPLLDGTLAAVEAAKAAVTGAERELRAIDLRGRSAARKRQQRDAEFQTQIGAQSEGFQAAEAERLRAFADVGRRVLSEKGRLVDVDSDSLNAVLAADKAVLERLTELEKHIRALDSYDEATFKRGIVVTAATVAFVVIGILVLALR